MKIFTLKIIKEIKSLKKLHLKNINCSTIPIKKEQITIYWQKKSGHPVRLTRELHLPGEIVSLPTFLIAIPMPKNKYFKNIDYIFI